MRGAWAFWAGAGIVLSAALALGGCEEKLAEADPIVIPPYSNTGQLDPTFGGDGVVFAATGIVTDNFSVTATGDDRGFTVTTDAVGNILVAGYRFTAFPDSNLAVWRLTPQGLLDVSFNGGTPFSIDAPGAANSQQEARGLALQANGNLVAAGSVDPGAGADPAVWRIFANGAGLDTTFNTGGPTPGAYSQAPTGSSGSDVATAVAVDSTGRIVVAGYSDQTGVGNSFDMFVWRFLSDGTLDAAFGTAGTFRTQAGPDERGFAMVLDGADNVYVAGTATSGGFPKITVWKLLGTDGTLDTTFGTSGAYTHTGTASADLANAIALDGLGRVLAAGAINIAGSDDAAVLRLTALGALDATFGTAGVTTLADLAGGTAVQDTFWGLDLDAYGRIVLTGAGGGPPGNGSDMVLVRLDANGNLDPSFATGGVAASNGAAGGVAAPDEFGQAVAVDSAGRIVVAGYGVDAAGGNSLIVWRYR